MLRVRAPPRRLSVNGASQGIVFRGWDNDEEVFPAVNFYSSNRAVRILRCERLSGFTEEAPAGVEGAAAATAEADAESSDEEEPPTPEALEAAHPGVTGLAGALGIPLESCAHAMQLASNNVETAADWLLTNADAEAARLRVLQSRREARRERRAKRDAEAAARAAAGDAGGDDEKTAEADAAAAAAAEAAAAEAAGDASAAEEEKVDFAAVKVNETPATHHEFIDSLLARMVEVSELYVACGGPLTAVRGWLAGWLAGGSHVTVDVRFPWM